MTDPEKAPLPSIVYEEIAQSWHDTDQEYWPKIAAFRRPNFVPPSQPVAPRLPTLLLKQIREYASALFKAETAHYHRIASDSSLRTWLSNLEARVLRHVFTAVKTLHEADPQQFLMVHGLEYPSLEKSLREMLWELGRDYASDAPKIVLSPPSAEAQPSQATKEQLTSNRQRIDGFILKMANAGLKVKRKDIWQVANYTDRTEFERFQRGTSRNNAAATTFNRVLSMAPEDFSKLVKREK
jgi:hypothetical protein